ncbi:hypothetical protein HYALB_00003252 [Hymenoscyphus albidus]|uniref:Uncharacterized protein n=1 Tax=Hymenoscyphus albidus TaxID=595503 RepID=A0A9N9LD59_9HELO|nr:hypothetical protein HYALB_00003252 [Hymenoscyphus albidus]
MVIQRSLGYMTPTNVAFLNPAAVNLRPKSQDNSSNAFQSLPQERKMAEPRSSFFRCRSRRLPQDEIRRDARDALNAVDRRVAAARRRVELEAARHNRQRLLEPRENPPFDTASTAGGFVIPLILHTIWTTRAEIDLHAQRDLKQEFERRIRMLEEPREESVGNEDFEERIQHLEARIQTLENSREQREINDYFEERIDNLENLRNGILRRYWRLLVG